MALHVPKAPGMAQMLKDGARMYSGMEETAIRNITACKEFAATVRSSYGPNGMNKMIINFLNKQFVTSDAATITRELDVTHPAAKLILLGSEMQESEIGDGTNFVIILAGSLLEHAEELLRLGVSATDIAEGFEKAGEKCIEILEKLVCYEIKDFRDIPSVKIGIKSAVMAKQYGQEDIVSDLIAKACVSVLKPNDDFDVDDVRVCKILGAGLYSSTVMSGMVFKRLAESDITKMKDAKIAMYSCPFDTSQTETKGTILIKSAEELLDYSRGEESLLESMVKDIADSGAKVIIAGGKIGDMAIHFINKYGMMAVRLLSKFDISRLSRSLKGTLLPRLTPPTEQEMGYCDEVFVDEIGETLVVVFKMSGTETGISTIVIRGSTDNSMDDIERAVDDGVNTYKSIIRDGRFVPGGGATEIELSKQLSDFADSIPSIDQYAVRKFAKALEVFPKSLADNSGINGTEVVNKLLLSHQEGNQNTGFDVDCETADICDVIEKNIFDLLILKAWGIKYAVGSVCTILRVDHIIMAKRSGAPVKPQTAQNDDD